MSKEEKKEKKPKKEKKEKKEKAPKGAKTVICPGCQTELPKKAKVCPNCGAKLKKKSILPLILILVVLLVAAAVVSVVVFSFPFALPFGGSKPETLAGEVMEMSGDQEEAALAVFAECGFGELTEVEKLKANTKVTTYAVNDAQTARYLDEEDGVVVEVGNITKAVESISVGDSDLYVRGSVVAPVTDFYLTTDERNDYLSASLDAVRKELDVPELAEFPSRSKWNFVLDGKNVTVQATVKVKDASGSEEVLPFQIEFEDGELVSLSFDAAGEEES